jgi:hypothetical protein
VNINPLAVLVIALAVVAGALFFGSWLWGLFVGLALVVAVTILPSLRA